MAERGLRPDQTGWLVVAAGVSLLPHAAQLPHWLSAVCALFLSWRGMLAAQRARLPHRALLGTLGLAVAGGVLVEYGHLFGKDPGIALLAAFLGLKLLETDDIRGGRAVILLTFFLQMGQFLHQQGMATAALALVGTVVSLATLAALAGRARPLRPRLTEAARLTVLSLPFMAVLFILFPRVQGPLWGLPADAFSALTGLSDTMTPGALARLSESGAIAFRATFDGPPPPRAQRYWRGPVLTRFDGHTWRAAHLPARDVPAYAVSGRTYTYTLTLEPHDRPWLLALDFPDAQAGLRYGADFQLLAREPVRSRLRQTLASYPDTPVGLDEPPILRRLALALPAGANPRTVAAGSQLRANAVRADDIPARGIALMRDARLTYTLEPPPLGEDDVDAFLFDTRQGFCEHFAAAFVVLMRAAGVPARVVTGYQGGEINPVDGSLEVRQSDAHAWAEVWLAGRGWLRVDPTAASAPARIERGLAAALPDTGHLPLLMRPELAWLQGLQHHLDALNHRWNQWVLGYNPARQRDLLAGLGLGEVDWPQLTGLMTAACAAVTAALAGVLLRNRRRDPVLRAWEGVCSRLAAHGLPRADWEGPTAYAARVGTTRPDLADAIAGLATDFARLRYGEASDTAARRDRFLHSARRFRPR